MGGNDLLSQDEIDALEARTPGTVTGIQVRARRS